MNANEFLMEDKPLIYSCSGCSSAAQMANYLAVQMDRKGLAEMSCIAGVGGNVKKLVKTAVSGRKIIVLDGCPLACAKACLQNQGVQPDVHVELTSLGVKKKQHEDFDKQQAAEIFNRLQEEVDLLQPSATACSV
ncbi:putative zinc-binding protein [Flavisolibacter ginsenosidimutans]|uniref:Zinc-binding protein n=1 Tax=Flavisolibacter ginsenosidimutans TaxID=661481 RepID=A0A5B8UHD3_9BACT|nr:putative zinc-binding protein [Flavisolibacter ginsenosidimutans]QEC56061.1 zinc-binding protein [Flavisolibacter ginsenosidimutans]